MQALITCLNQSALLETTSDSLSRRSAEREGGPKA